jgi:hypothetical protein
MVALRHVRDWGLEVLVRLLVAALVLAAGLSPSSLSGQPYLGQEPPGATPKVFAPGIVSTDAEEGCTSFSKDGRLLLLARARSNQDGILPPSVSPDGRYFLFTTDKSGDRDIYWMDATITDRLRSQAGSQP